MAGYDEDYEYKLEARDERIRKLETEVSDLSCQLASIVDLINSYCREHHITETSDAKDGIHRLVCKLL